MINYIKQLITASAFTAVALCSTASFAAENERKHEVTASDDTTVKSEREAADNAAAMLRKRLVSEPGLNEKLIKAVQNKDNDTLTKLVRPPTGVSIRGHVDLRIGIKVCFSILHGTYEVCITLSKK